MNEDIITFDDLYKKISKSINNSEDLDQIKQAYDFALNIHDGEIRLSGEEMINHPLQVAMIITDLNYDATTIVAALIHEVLDTKKTTIEEIEKTFGKEVAKIIDSISKINKLELSDTTEASAIYLRKILVGLALDVRVLYIKLADRLHNMRTLHAIKIHKQKLTALETEKVLIPIAHRLGINKIKSELEDLCLRYIRPEVYQDILNQLNASKNELSVALNEMKDEISDILREHEIPFEIKSRVKSVHSIFKKLDTGRKFSDIYDILALRIFAEKESDCYLIVGLIHSKFRPIPKRFKDFIAMPKANLYQSLHTTVFGVDGYLFEVQIRTHEMDEIAEKGIASHWSYKEKGSKKIQNIMEQKLEMFRNLIEAGDTNSTDLEFATNANNEFLSELIYVFTPKGDVVELPNGSTPIDFAYRIHSGVGDKTTGALVNNVIVPLDYILNDGDIIKIITKTDSTPNKEWLSFVKTSQAKNKIKSFFSKIDKTNYVEKGRELIEREIRRRKLSISEVLSSQNINKVAKDLKLESLEDIYLSIGSFRYTPNYIINLAYEDKINVEDALLEKVRTHVAIPKIDYKNDLIVAGTQNIKVSIAKCCNPVYGDLVAGYITRGQGISVHRNICHNIKDETMRLIDVDWNQISEKIYFSDLQIETDNHKSYLIDIVSISTKKDVYIEEIKNETKDKFNIISLKVKVKNITELENYMNELNKIKAIKKIIRIIN